MPKDEVTLANAEMVEGVLWDVWYYLIWRCKFDNVRINICQVHVAKINFAYANMEIFYCFILGHLH